jgi:hypothetical protein
VPLCVPVHEIASPDPTHVQGCCNYPHAHAPCRWGRRAISFFVPKDFEPVLSRYMEGRALLAQPDNPFLLCSATGKPYDLSNFNQRWSRLLAIWGAPARFSPQVPKRCPARFPMHT